MPENQSDKTDQESTLNELLDQANKTRQAICGYYITEIPCPRCGEIQDFSGESIGAGSVYDCDHCELPMLIKAQTYYQVVLYYD